MSQRKRKTDASRELRRVIGLMEWAERMFDESVVPGTVDVDALLQLVEKALRDRQREATQRQP